VEDVDLGVCQARLYRGAPERVVVVLPGARYLPFAPLLWFAREIAQRHGWTVLEVWDEYRDGTEDWGRWVDERARAAFEHAGSARVALVTKSMSSRAVTIAADRSIAGVWLTPLLVEPEVAAGFARLEAPALLVGGSADESWDGELGRSLGKEVLEIDGADHRLQIPGDPLASVDALRRVVERMDAFVAARTTA
jgi:hypothetical protein